MICPFLGLKDDPATSYSYSSVFNYCNLAKPPYTPKIYHQEAYCLADAYETCPVFLRQQKGSLPPKIRAPRSWPVWGVNQWKVVLAVLFILSLVIIGWNVFAQGLISTALDRRIATPSEIGIFQSSAIFPGLTSTTSETASSHPTPTTTPTALMTRTKTKTPRPTTIHPPTLTYNPTLANQTITFNPLLNKTYGDLPFTVSASATSGLAVSFSTSGTCSNTGSTISITGAGSCTVIASQTGNANYNPASTVSRSFNIAKGTAICNIGWSGTYDGNPHGATGSCTGVGSLVIDPNTFINYPGGTADWSYTGDANYNSQSGTANIAISKAYPTFSFDSPGDQYYIDSPFDITVSAIASSGATVTFTTSSATGSCTNSGSTITITGTGTCTVTASAGSTSNYKSGSKDVTFNITGP